ncbi:MAG: hypothetical protein EBU90_06555 [Proteobacteria bacterium]|nr:hypothetical protein [Pseudomonadota bacterium]
MEVVFFICQAVIVINSTTTWNANDQKALERASKRCEQVYKDAPCLKKFYKIEENRYSALCGNSQ